MTAISRFNAPRALLASPSDKNQPPAETSPPAKSPSKPTLKSSGSLKRMAIPSRSESPDASSPSPRGTVTEYTVSTVTVLSPEFSEPYVQSTCRCISPLCFAVVIPKQAWEVAVATTRNEPPFRAEQQTVQQICDELRSIPFFKTSSWARLAYLSYNFDVPLLSIVRLIAAEAQMRSGDAFG
jgi:hypothetical protein